MEKLKSSGTIYCMEQVLDPNVTPGNVNVSDDAAMDVDKSLDGEGKDGKDSYYPPTKYKMTEAMKGLIWNLVCLSNECCRIGNEKKYVRGP